MLNATVTGEGNDHKLLLAHGLFGSGRNLGIIAKRLSDAFEVTSVDMRNHGSSPWFDTHTYFDMADDLADFADGDVMGHSMGGKAAMVLALRHPEKVRRLIVADIAPVGYQHTQMHLVEAMKALDTDQPSRSAARDALDVPEDVKDFLIQSFDVKNKRWLLNLDVLGAEMDKIVGFPDVSGTFEGPTLFLSGGDSDYVKREHRDRIKSLFPNAKFAKIPGSGHWIHAEKPREFEAAIRTFCS
ncbi:alpha/beta fold hydrolase [Pelagovum pacificum]|uniref:Alpha/beta fold hydrolase n=1 Tax=Pelagovum pacificum TaxID=2588711 RepID=A0A5C5GG96_9RHOB|nr:alpha/beta fold hydrolase [Pelagovum pacificum]QQA43293.1 alpha/beta fold hydrolase [Pelagovum pacificum]TNY33570.1 alpha/beta fold hydrolase [Pelagovum pacificum]